ncbi:hypothetical protein GGR57DRAFT_465213 [Xylariaceae sp. FL1272]|nr:hypothetical protein GGR57DRAFT_465213 [Xylariaceae sp. FL1272]
MLSSFWKQPQIPKIMRADPDPPAPLLSTWRVRAEAGEPEAIVRVRNLQSTMTAGRDAWGRTSKSQPVLLSSEVSFAQAFDTASTSDSVNAETVHYGNLSKTLLAGMEYATSSDAKKGKEVKKQDVSTPSTGEIFELLWVKMTGRLVDGSTVALPPDQVPFLDAKRLRSLSLTLHLPKASLLGGGVSLTTTAAFKDAGTLDEEEKRNPLRSYSRCLRFHGLHIPSLIGVNSNERDAKQMVVADVEIDRYDLGQDMHTELERIIVDTIQDSCFETLEALGTHLGNIILNDFRIGDNQQAMRERGWQVRICLEKPIAVPFADCPSVEVRMGPK